MIDFYQDLASKWKCERKAANIRALTYVYGNPTAPEFLCSLDPDTRADILAHYGIIVGEN